MAYTENLITIEQQVKQSFAAFSFILLQIFSFPVTFNIFFLDAYNQYIIGI